MNKAPENAVAGNTDSVSGDNALNEKELENVSGGFELPTIIDLCQNKFDMNRCIDAPWGTCKHFNRVFVKEDNGCFYYTGSCDKGCFKDITYPRVY